MKRYTYLDSPLRVLGVPHFEEKRVLRRLPEEIANRYCGVLGAWPRVGLRCAGGRLAFRTNSETLKIGVELSTLSPDIGMAIFACQSVNVLVGNYPNLRYAGLVSPAKYENKSFEGVVRKSSRMEDVTLYLPMAELVENVWVEIDDGAEIEAPTPPKHSRPLVFYGSSITEGAHACHPFSSYTALLSQRLDVDYYNFGFSGSAKGQLDIAEYTTTLDMSAYIMDYDHNAPDVEYLQKTHEPFFRFIRERKPDTPIVITSLPNFEHKPQAKERREVIRATYERAVADGDKNVYFIDGETFFGTEERYLCTTDTCHPNDLGHYLMAKGYEPILRKILGE